MNRTFWKTAIVCGLAVSLVTNSLFARGGHGGGGGGGGGGGQAGHGGGGGGGHPGGGGSRPGGGNPGVGNPGGGSHPGGANPGGGHPGGGNPGGGTPQQHGNGNLGGVNHGPIGNTSIPGRTGGSPVVTGSPQIGHHPIPNGGFGGNPQGNFINQHPGGGNPGGHSVMPVNQPGGHHQPANWNQPGGPGHQHFNGNNFVGNSVHFGNRPIQLSNAAYRPSYYNHAGYYHGYWNGSRGYGGYGWGPGYRYGGYGYRPYFWGLGGWGLGSLIYGSGYMGYYNPYYTTYSGVGYNYAQPIPVYYNQPTVVADPNTPTANSSDAILNSAIAAFKQNNYDAALDLVNQGITQHPDDAVLHEFRGLVLFAKGDYQQAAATVHSVLAVGPGWDWTTLSGLYADIGLYTTQLRQLEATVKQNPMDAATRFLLAYHYLSDGYPDAAVRQLQQVVMLLPNDQVAASLLKMTSAPQETPNSDPAALPTPQPPVDIPPPGSSQATPVDPATIIGSWNAAKGDGSRFALMLANDKTFTWTFTPKQQQPQSFNGTYSLDGNVIALEREGGGSLVAEITSINGSGFNFKMVGAPPEDPGLNFAK
ncbi:tetratricopeptide repeat protein [Schlesneria paludicola]|uniref:tetratricopeptide repeat protein n=1 Tax=Schlesneria paludicola TaxID=360056 RepID=UPI001ED90F44|nr:tetratricopeptide repeat protein [Schlesneria paludicola]